MNASQTFACRRIAIAYRVSVNVLVALAHLTGRRHSEHPTRITVVTVRAGVTPQSGIPGGTFGAHDHLFFQLNARSVVWTVAR